MQYPEQLLDLLNDIEQEMRVLKLWQEDPPPSRDLESKNPFCYDTLSFDQWLQWVFMPRMREVLSQGIPLPAKSEIAPAAELYFEQDISTGEKLIDLLNRFDQLMPEAQLNESV